MAQIIGFGDDTKQFKALVLKSYETIDGKLFTVRMHTGVDAFGSDCLRCNPGTTIVLKFVLVSAGRYKLLTHHAFGPMTVDDDGYFPSYLEY